MPRGALASGLQGFAGGLRSGATIGLALRQEQRLSNALRAEQEKQDRASKVASMKTQLEIAGRKEFGSMRIGARNTFIDLWNDLEPTYKLPESMKKAPWDENMTNLAKDLKKIADDDKIPLERQRLMFISKFKDYEGQTGVSLDKGLVQALKAMEPEKGIAVKPTEAVVSPTTGKVIYKGQPAPTKPPTPPKTLEEVIARGLIDKKAPIENVLGILQQIQSKSPTVLAAEKRITSQERIAAQDIASREKIAAQNIFSRERIAASGNATKEAIAEGKLTGDVLNQTLKIQKQFANDDRVETWRDLERNYTQLSRLIDGINTKSYSSLTPPDIAIANSVSKIFDPGGVVRQSDIANITENKAVMDTAAVAWNKYITQRGGVLSDDERDSIRKAAEVARTASRVQYEQAKALYRGIAELNPRINPDLATDLPNRYTTFESIGEAYKLGDITREEAVRLFNELKGKLNAK